MLRPRARRRRECATTAARVEGRFDHAEKSHQMSHYTPTKTDARGEKQTGEERENDPSKHTLRLPIIQKWLKIVDVSRSDEESVYTSRSALHHRVKETNSLKRSFRNEKRALRGQKPEDTPNGLKDGVSTNPPHKAVPKQIGSELADQTSGSRLTIGSYAKKKKRR